MPTAKPVDPRESTGASGRLDLDGDAVLKPGPAGERQPADPRLDPVVTLTVNPALDRTMHIASVRPQAKLRCSRVEDIPGGGGINVARVICELGGPVRALWAGGGDTGDAMERLLARGGLDQQRIPVAGATRVNLTVHDDKDDEYRFVEAGPGLTPPELDRCRQAVLAIDPPPAWLVLSGSLPPGANAGFYGDLVDAIDGSTRVVLDTSGPALAAGCRPQTWLIKPNLRELAQLTNREVTQDVHIVAASRKVIDERGVSVVMTSLGAGGLVVVTADAVRFVRSPTVPIRSTIGAGDSSVGGLVWALQAGRSLDEATRHAAAAGAAAVMLPGRRLLRREDVDELLRDGEQSKGTTGGYA